MAMATGKIHQPMGLSTRAVVFQSKVASPHNRKLVQVEEKPVALTSSAVLKERSLSTRHRVAASREVERPRITQLRDMSETSCHKFSGVDLQQSLFQPFPLEVVFQNYIPSKVYEVPLVLRNSDKVPRRVKVVMESSPCFKVVSPCGVYRKVPPGMTTTFRILFTPEENKDYFHQLTCITEREEFIVPIRAIGARGILDFPGQLHFSICPVNYSTQKTLLVRNVGDRKVCYRIDAQSPFSVDPSIGNLETGESTQVTVEFHPLETGNYCRSLVVHYDTGEDTHTGLYGAAVDVDLALERSCLTLEKTYLTMANRSSVVIHNRSGITAHFQWKAFATQEEEDQLKLRLCRELQEHEEDRKESFLRMCKLVPTLQWRLPHLSSCFQKKEAKVQGDSMLFADDVFTIDPVEGDVLPNSSFEINVIFKPREARVCEQTVYCDISGREARLPLHIKGEGMGPRLCLSFDQLDMGNIFIGSSHSYEAILFNKGAIDAPFSLVPPTTAHGSCFTLLPTEGIISPDGLQVINISFSSTILGKFKEEFMFRVKGSPEPVTLTIRGCVIGPTFHFNVPSLCFGDVSFGFPRTLSCRLTNSSSVPMTFRLGIPGDGSGEPSVTSSLMLSSNTCPFCRRGAQGHIRPSEFTVTPNEGTILPQGFLDIQVTLCSNTVRRYKLELVVDVEGVGRKVSALPLTARCVVPPLRVLSPALTFGECFLKVPYRQMLTLENNSDLPGCYRVLPQEPKDAAAVRYSSPVPCGIVQPHGRVDVPFTLEAQVVGKQDTVAHVVVFGREESPLEIHLVSIGEGPVVYIHPNKINFGSIQVLQDVSQTLYLSNQTLAPASFRAEMAGKCSHWRIEPSEGVIPPSAEVSVAVIVNLDGTATFKDEVKVFIENSRSYNIPVQAVGVGTTIVTDKPFAPELNLGPQFSLLPVCYRFKVTNKGRRPHLLYWTTEGFSTFCQSHRLPALSSSKSKDSSQNSKSACPVFRLRPLRMELMPGKSMEMVLEGFSSTPEVVKERLLCHAVVGNKAGKELIMQADVTCQFIVPALQVSPREVTFWAEKKHSDPLALQYKPLSLKNISALPFSIFLALEQPFLICDEDQQPLRADVQPVKLEAGEELHLSVKCNLAYEEGLNSSNVEKALNIQILEHPHEEQVTIRVYFPNVRIQTTAVDFGCISNDTKVVRYIEMTNCSLFPAQYSWAFVTERPASQIRFSPPTSQFFIKPQPPKEKRSQLERSASAESSSRNGGAEEPARALGAAENPLLDPADADDSLGEKPLPSIDVKREGAVKTWRMLRFKKLMQFTETERSHLGIQDVFDIMPLYGVLQPGESQRVMFTFFGHANIVAQVTAQCRVEGGPTHEVVLSGEASLISYLLDTREIDYGLKLFHQVSEAEVTLRNRGKLGFTYTVQRPSEATADCPQPDESLVLPSTGYLEPGKEQVLKVCYLPGVPGVFCRTFKVQVGHLEPDEFSLKGEADFPRISLDLPRNIKGNDKYEKILKMAQDRQGGGAFVPEEAVAAEPPTDSSGTVLEPGLQMQMEQMLVEEHALEQQKALASSPLKDTAFDQPAHWRLLEVELPEYILDLGYVILGTICTRAVRITNTGQFPVSFCAAGRVLRGTGFRVEPQSVKDLPCRETATVEVRFDPESANLSLGEVDVLLPIKVAEGPTVHVHLHANVTLPSLCLSKDQLEFSTVQCGQCKEVTVQLCNQQKIPCRWFITINEPDKKASGGHGCFERGCSRHCDRISEHCRNEGQSSQTKETSHHCITVSQYHKMDKHMPKGARRKLPLELKRKADIFTALPSAGALSPGQRCNVRVRFSPMEEKSYKSTLKINICQGSQQLHLEVSGHGLEPQLEFSPTVLELGPLLPNSCGVEGTVVVKNPCEFPIEFYSLEFDQQYLVEEEILRNLKGYNCQNTLLLPPRALGQKLPPEVLEYYENQKKLQEKSTTGKPAAEQQQSTAGSEEAAGEQDDSPVSRAIARHFGIDTSAEARAAEKRRGIVVVVHGAPLTGKTSAAVALSKYYGAACLSIDAVVTEAIAEGRSSAGLRARELCIAAALEHSREGTEDAGESAGATLQWKLNAERKHSLDRNRSGFKQKYSQQSSRSRVQEKSHCQPIFYLPWVPAPQRLSISGSTEGQVGFMSCVLPEDLLVDILSKRLQLSDCYQGVVFDGLETLFAHNVASALHCLLKAVGNCPHIYFVNLCRDYTAWKAGKLAAKEQEEWEKEEAARREEAHLWEVDEEEYETLTEEQKTRLNNSIRQLQRERRKREMKQLARELEEKQQRKLERSKKKEEVKKSPKAGKRQLGKDTDRVVWRKSQPGDKQNIKTLSSIAPIRHQLSVSEVADTRGPVKESANSVAGSKADMKQQSNIPSMLSSLAVPVEPTDPEQQETESEKSFDLRLKIYDASQKDVVYILSSWDRGQGVLLPSLSQKEMHHKHLPKQRSQRDSKKSMLEKERREKKHQDKEWLLKLKSSKESEISLAEGKDAEGSSRHQDVGVPCLDIQMPSPENVTRMLLQSGKLPAAEEILNDLGLGPSGPPLPLTAFYSVVHYPEERVAPAAGEEALERFILVEVEDATVEKKITGSHLDVPTVPTVQGSKGMAMSTRGRSKKEKAAGSQKQSSSQDRRSHHGRRTRSPSVKKSSVNVVPPPRRAARLSHCRWIVPAHGKVKLNVHFSPTELGQFEQTLHFEILGTKRQYQLQCRGSCLYPTISQDPRVVFPQWTKSKADNDIIVKQYVMDTGVFHFGPLPCGKSGNWYKAQNCPDNCEKITILNATALAAEVHFFFERDRKMDKFFVQPTSMRLQPHEKQELSVWAYPTATGIMADKLLCCVKENPEPVVFRLCCEGVRVEVEVSPLQVYFGRLLLNRSDSQTLTLHNCTRLPVAWNISGLKNLGKAISVSQDTGTIGPHKKCDVHLYFKATDVCSIRNMFQIEFSDARNLLGKVQTENIEVIAEAYEVGLDISVPKGGDQSVDFGAINVLNEAKQVLTLKNKGTCTVAYRFKLETADPTIPDLASHFTVQPQKGVITTSNRLAWVQLLFHPKKAMKIVDKVILRCQVLDASSSEEGEIITIIPVSVSASAVFSKYRICPASLLNFGVMLKGTRKTSTFTLENKGVLPFKFNICRARPGPSERKLKTVCSHKKEDASENASVVERTKSQDAGPAMALRFTLGMFTVYPGYGSIPPGGRQTVTVECYAVPLGRCKEHLSIDIHGRDPKDNPLGILYTLFAESCVPAFVVDDIESIFEEHQICNNTNLCQVLQTMKDKGVFIRDENRFLFTNVLVGHQARARFKICNVKKVPCDVSLSVKPIGTQHKSQVKGVFKVDPNRMCVPSHSHAFATVTFTPLKAQNYQCTFEAALDAQASFPGVTAQNLTFSISGDGNLPQLTVLHPALRDERENPLLVFKKLLLGDSEELPLVLQNSGIVPVKFVMDLLDEGGVFFLKARPSTHCIYEDTDREEGFPGAGRKPHTASLVLLPGESAEFDVLFKPILAQRVEGKIHLLMAGNHLEETNIWLVGDGSEADFVLENIHGRVADSKEGSAKGNLKEDIIEAVRMDHIQFGDCHVGTPYSATFTITNRSREDAMRFEWRADAPFHFSPKVGHLHAGCSKDITVTLASDVPVTFTMHPVKCSVARIAFQLPPEEVTDWDDRLHTVMGKAIKTKEEPALTVLENSSHEVELHISAVIDYAKFKLDSDVICFRKTMVFQTRTFNFQLSNKGRVALEYNWMAGVEQERERPESSLEGEFLSSSTTALVSPQSSQCWSELEYDPGPVSASWGPSQDNVSATPQFSVEPCSGTIPAGQRQLFQMKFCPVRMGQFECRMVCRIPNLKPDQKDPEVVVKGRSKIPYCHFELEDSDYLTAKRRKAGLKGPTGEKLEPSTRVIEFAATGVRSRNSRTFVVMNTTNSAYSFRWTCQDPKAPAGQAAFFCLTETGHIRPGNKAEMKFEFIPRHLDITESFWVFTIPEESISIPFLLVGNATDPLVILDRRHINFHSLLVGRGVQHTIHMINKEKKVFSFSFRENSLLSEKCDVKIQPQKGSIAPLSRLPITVVLKPKQEGEVVFNIKCDVKMMSQPLSLNIKATGYSKKVG